MVANLNGDYLFLRFTDRRQPEAVIAHQLHVFNLG